MAIEGRSGALRMSLLAAVAVGMFIALFARLWFLQILNETEFVARAADNTTEVIIEQAPRGRILDARGRVLVDNRPSIVVTIDREEVDQVRSEDRDDLFFRLAQELSRAGRLTKVAEIEEAYASTRFGPFAEVPVVYDITEELQVYLAEHSHLFPGVGTTVITVREYPYGDLAAHVLGYVGPLNEAELEAVQGKPKTYLPNDEIGKTGIELFYEDALRGTPGRKTVTVDKFNNILDEVQDVEPQAGSDVQLTIDLEIQALAERELAAGLDRARQQATKFEEDGIIEFTAPAGALVILDPRDGAVVAMASYPTYDPDLFVSGISQRDFDELNDEDSGLPLLNRAIQGEYPPGSTFKPFTAYAALDTGLIGSRGILGVRSGWNDQGIYRIPGCEDSTCVFRNAGEVKLGVVDLPLALTYSSDTYFYNLAASFDILGGFDSNSIQVAAAEFGYGESSGITLPAESIGRLPTAAARLEAHQANPEAFPNPQWTTGDTVITAIGQGDVLATPLQMANSYAALANGGTLYSPNLAAAILDPITGDVEREFAARVIREIYYPEAFSGPIEEGLAGVTTYRSGGGIEGTAYDAFVGFPHQSWPVRGKTGTAEKFATDRLVADYALFSAWGPAAEPQFVATIVMEEAGFGGQVAAPVIRTVLEAIATDTVPPVYSPDEIAEQERVAAELAEQAAAEKAAEDAAADESAAGVDEGSDG